MGMIQNILKGSGEKAEFKERFKQAQQDERIMRMVEERNKSANQRELERYVKEQEEAKIKETLDKIRNKQNSELWKSKNGVLDKGKSILKDDRPILKEKNIFMKNKNMFMDDSCDMGFFK